MTGKKNLNAKRKPGRRKQKQTPPKRLPLTYYQRQVLVDFLNHDFSKPVKLDAAGGYIDANGCPISGELHMIIHRDLSLGSLDHLESLRQRLMADLSPIADLPAQFRKTPRMQEYLLALTAKLDQMRFEPRFKVVAGTGKGARRLLTRDQKIFSRGSGEWIITMDFSAGISYSPERDLCGMIAEALINGQLDLLRRCPYCRLFFTANEPRQTYCMPEHGILFHRGLKKKSLRAPCT